MDFDEDFARASQQWSPLSLSPVLWYKGDNNATDSSASGFTGTWSGTTAYTSGVNGAAFSFNGSSSVSKTFESSLATSNTTICLWMNVAPVGIGTVRIALSMRQNAPSRGYYNGVSAANTFVHSYAYSDAGPRTLGTNAVLYSQWVHVCFVANGTNLALYINGAIVDSRLDTYLPATTSSFMVGALVDGGPRLFFTGGIDDVIIFNRALTASDISKIYNWRQ